MRRTVAGLLAGVVLGAGALTACSDGGPDPDEVLDEYVQQRDAGASCAELFAIRNELDPKDVMVEAINEGLRKIGCFSATSDRTDLEDATEETGAELNGVSLCEDPDGDGAAGDLVAVQLAASGQFLNIAWDTTAPLPGGEVSFYLNLFGDGLQIGLRQIDGEVVRFVANLDGGGQENLTGDYSIDGTTASLVVPVDALGGLEQPFDYSGAITVAGTDVDSCDATFPN